MSSGDWVQSQAVIFCPWVEEFHASSGLEVVSICVVLLPASVHFLDKITRARPQLTLFGNFWVSLTLSSFWGISEDIQG